MFKKIILWIFVVIGVLMVYFSSYLPFAKSSTYINAVKRAQNLKSLQEFKQLFDTVFNFYSPVGGEEVVKFLSNDITSLINQERATEEISKLIVEYIEPKFFPNNVRHMITGARMYETLWRKWGREEYYLKAEEYYLKAKEIGPKLPPVLYGLTSLYFAHNDFNKVQDVAREILKYWPEDSRVEVLLAQPKIEVIDVQ